MTRPSALRLFEVLDATWPAEQSTLFGPWRLRKGNGGGQRVSAATAESLHNSEDIGAAEQKMLAMGQHPLFMIRDDGDGLDTDLAQRGYQVVDPTLLYLGRAVDLSENLPSTVAMPSWPPLAVQREVWASGGVGPARIAVMERCTRPKTSILGRSGDVPAGTAFVATDGDIAMVHAIEVDPAFRKRGVGRHLMQACANWAALENAKWLCLAVTRANEAANALYSALGMSEVASYHYRAAPGATG